MCMWSGKAGEERRAEDQMESPPFHTHTHTERERERKIYELYSTKKLII